MNSSLTFTLEAFSGPLDLLLHLISKHKLNINDIEISVLLEQYLEYISDLSEQDFESAGEFLEMAARLIYIKTVSLLPQPEEAEELKKELQGRLVEYSLCKAAALRLREEYIGGDSYVREPMKIEVDKTYSVIHEPIILLEAYQGISARVKKAVPLKAEIFEPIVSHRIVSVTSKIIFVLKSLYNTGKCEMDKLYDGVTDKSERVATFLAVLELTKSGRIIINDDNTELYFVRRYKNGREPSGYDEAKPDDVVEDELSEAITSVEEKPVEKEYNSDDEFDDLENYILEYSKKKIVPKPNLWSNPVLHKQYRVAQGLLRKANFWGYVKKGTYSCN